MDKIQFVQEAPLYYALAIAAELESVSTNRAISQYAIRGKFNVDDDTEPEGSRCLLDRDTIWDAAIDWLRQNELIRITKATFGPPVYFRADDFHERWDEIKKISPFSQYDLIDAKSDWLVSALWEVNNTYENLGVTFDDFVRPVDDWEPIKIDRDGPATKNAVDKLTAAVEDVRKDNGYAVKFAEERNFVVDGLTNTIHQLEGGSVTPGYIRDALNKLEIIVRRFKGAALEIVAVAARQALIDFIKSQGGDLLRALKHIFFPW